MQPGDESRGTHAAEVATPGDAFTGPALPAGRVVAVAGARGGAGASTLACGLAVAAAASGQPVLLVDTDPWGGGLDLLLGAEDEPGLRWPDLRGLRGVVSAAEVRRSLPTRAGVAVLSCDRVGDPVAAPAEAVAAVLDGCTAAGELVVVDLSRSDDGGRGPVLSRAACTLLVVPSEVRATAAAALLGAALRSSTPHARLVVREPSPAGLDAHTVAAAVGLPLAARWRSEAAVVSAAEQGRPPPVSGRGPLASVCRTLLPELLPRWAAGSSRLGAA